MAIAINNKFASLNVENPSFSDSDEDDTSSDSSSDSKSVSATDTPLTPRLDAAENGENSNEEDPWKDWKKVERKKQKRIFALPIHAQKDMILQAIADNPVVVLCGSTGTGKTTQVPKFLYEAGYGRKGIIGITEPRRLAATSMARRVSEEMHLNREVSFHIRFWNTRNRYTKILFLTDGVLFKYFLDDNQLSEFSVLIIDEAHQRSVHSDTIIGLLTKLIQTQRVKKDQLKVIIMSATLRVEDFVHDNLFHQIPRVIEIDARKFPINIYYSQTELTHYFKAAHIKVCKIHQHLPEGGILVFLPTKSDILNLCHKLDKHNRGNDDEFEAYHSESDSDSDYKEYNYNEEKDKSLYEIIMTTAQEELYLNYTFSRPIHPLPLYSKLSIEEQQRIYNKVPKGSRLCIISTDLAETSLTIPGIKYVVDAGKNLRCSYDDWRTTKDFQINWTSKAAAIQRAGRSGRESEGYCFRLYTMKIFEDMIDYTKPDISEEPIDDIVLQLKYMGVNSISTFPFPSHPPKEKVEIVEQRLIKLGALKEVENNPGEACDYLGTITDLGAEMAKLPIFPNLSLILIKNVRSEVIQYIIALACALSVDEIFKSNKEAPNDALIKQWKEIKEKWLQKDELLGDLSLLLNATIESLKANFNSKFCLEHGLRMEAMKEINKIRVQMTKNLKSMYPLDSLKIDCNLPFPSKKECIEIRNIFLTWLLPFGFLAKRNKTNGDFMCMEIEKPAKISHHSILFQNCSSEFIVFYSPVQYYNALKVNNVFMVDEKQIMEAGRDLLQVKHPETPSYNKKADKVVYRVTQKLGFIKLKKTQKEIEESEFLYRWFGYFFLNGHVFKSLKFIVSQVINRYGQIPSSNVGSKQENQTLENFFQLLIKFKVCHKKTLVEIWENESCEKEDSFLFKEISDLLDESQRKPLQKIWPPVSVKKKEESKVIHV